MKVYVLTHCAAEENYTPSVWMNHEDAKEALKKIANQYVESSNLLDYWIENNAASFTWIDDTYDVLNIFEVDIIE